MILRVDIMAQEATSGVAWQAVKVLKHYLSQIAK